MIELENLWRAGGPAAWLFLGSLVVVLGTVAAGLVVGSGRDRPSPAVLRAVSAAPLIGLLIHAMAMVALVERGRGGLAGIILGSRDSFAGDGHFAILPLALSPALLAINALRLGCLTLAILVPLCALAAVRPLTRLPDRDAALPTVVGAVLGLLATIIAPAGALHVFALMQTLETSMPLSIAETGPAIARAVTSLNERLDLFEQAVVVVGAVAAAIGVVAVTRSRPTGGGYGWLAGSVLLLGLGIGAYAITRDRAHDARHPVALTDFFFLMVDWPDRPRSAVCRELDIAPVLEIDVRGEMFLDGRRVDERALGEDLATMRRNYGILHPGEPFPGMVTLDAPGGPFGEEGAPVAGAYPRDRRGRPPGRASRFYTPAGPPRGVLARALTIAAANGYRSLQIATTAIEPVSTRTLGTVRVRKSCAVRVILGGPDARPLSRFRSLQQIAGRAERERLTIDPAR